MKKTRAITWLGCCLAAGLFCGLFWPACSSGSGTDGGASTCRRDFQCRNGACSCTTSGKTSTSCCDPDVCGAAAPTSCSVVCTVCTGEPPDAAAGVDGGATTEPPVTNLAECSPTPDPCTVGCKNEMKSGSSCASLCGTDTPAKQYGCHLACAAYGSSASTCASACGVKTSCGIVGCYRACAAYGSSGSTCRSACGMSAIPCTSCGESESPQDACFKACTAYGSSTSTCNSVCG